MNAVAFDKEPVSITAYDWVPDFAQGMVRDLRLRWALEEAGLPYEVELVPQGTQARAHNLSRQPFGQIPTLTAGPETMFESGACVWRIAGASESLLPGDEAGRDRCLSWVFAALNTVEPPLSMMATLFFFETQPEQFGIADAGAVATIKPGARAAALLRLKQLADVLGKRRHLVADRFTIADLMMVTVLRVADSLDLLAELPDLRRYVSLHTARPAFRKALEGQLAPFRENAAKYETAG
ncbi:putative Glutathione S-transferase [uncultured Pleomorphomonas sp.]|uniref:Putative Glutathione S-transferase n=1 Tax=uncultured Pleomorphomonas sp. TaxID=442121 RepID=A0A212LFW3_9HYPH|nr:glutathione S-transferase family protein [uncultured Pleomorphomonas sp.]SCM76435.1 putative Glutathione S-transferase [uncultured Pleomorphomonas sp.]